MIGTTVGKYRIVGQLGRGATGIVYRAVDETLDREVAIKVLNPDLAETDVMQRFRVEATTLARLNHPEIATIHELLRTGTDVLMVMELVRGETLEAVSQRLGAIPPDRAAYLADRILSALEHAHRAGIVHRDLKPANVMVTEHGGVKIMDFGIARVRGAEHMTLDGCTIGTPAYMPPEQVLGEEVDGRADLYSVGVIFYRLLTGALPFEADTPIGMLRKHVADAPTPLRAHRDDIPDWCETTVQRALAKAPDDRFASAAEFRATLARATGMAAMIDLARTFAVPAAASPDARPEPAAARTLPVARTAFPVPEAADEERRSDTAPSFVRFARPDLAALVLSAKHVARGWEIPLLLAGALLGMLAYSALGGSGMAPIVAEAPPPVALQPQVAFQVKALLGSGSRQAERDVMLSLADGSLTVTPVGTPDEPLYTVPYPRVLSVTYSRATNPMWKSPKGAVPVVRAGGGTLGKFGIFVQRHWIVLQTETDTEFVVLRVEEGQARKILTTLAERSGRTPESIFAR